MRCKACDDLLEGPALSRKGLFTGEFIDLCDGCFDTIRDDIVISESETHGRDQSDLEN